MEREENAEIPLSELMRQTSCEIVELVNDYSGLMGLRFPLDAALRLARLVFGEEILWEDVKKMYQKNRIVTENGRDSIHSTIGG
jgi:hypothetical protein